MDAQNVYEVDVVLSRLDNRQSIGRCQARAIGVPIYEEQKVVCYLDIGRLQGCRM